jgi:chromosome segregation ATPase
VEAMQGAHVAELEENNAKLLAELEQTRRALAEAKTAWNSLAVSRGKLEEECIVLHATVEALGQDKARAVAAHCWHS